MPGQAPRMLRAPARPPRWLAVLAALACAFLCAPPAPAQDASQGSDEGAAETPQALPTGLRVSQPRLSPDGVRIAFLGVIDNVSNVWVGPADNPGVAAALTEETAPGVGEFRWAHTGEHLLYVTGAPGDPARCVRVVNVLTREVRDISPPQGAAARIVGVSSRRPDEALIAHNERDPAVFDLYRVNIRAARSRAEFQNPGRIDSGVVTSFIVDHDLSLRMLRAELDDGGFALLRLVGGGFEPFLAFPADDAPASEPLGFDDTGRVLYLLDDRGRAHAALVAINVETGETSVLASLEHAPILGAIRRAGGHVQAVRTADPAAAWLIIDRSLEPDFQLLRAVADGDLRIVSRSLDGNVWIVSFTKEGEPARFFKYNRVERRVRGVF